MYRKVMETSGGGEGKGDKQSEAGEQERICDHMRGCGREGKRGGLIDKGKGMEWGLKGR